MNPMLMAADYEDFLDRVRRDMSQLEEYNLGRFADSFAALSGTLINVIEDLRAFR